MKTITPEELKAKIDSKENIQLIELREDYEYDEFNLGGLHIPLDQIMDNLDKLDNSKEIIFCCNSGKKSAAAIHTIKRKHGIDNIYSLKGGLYAYIEMIF